MLDETISPDGRTLAVRGDDGYVVFFDTRTLRRVRSPVPGTNQERSPFVPGSRAPQLGTWPYAKRTVAHRPAPAIRQTGTFGHDPCIPPA